MTPDDPDAVALLLPFHVNGTLDEQQSTAVASALAQSAELRGELAMITQLAQRVKSGGKAMTPPEIDEQRLDATLKRLDAPATPPPAPPPTQQGLAGLLAFLHPKRWKPAVALSLVVAVGVQAAVIGNLSAANKDNAAQIAGLNKQVGDLQYALASGPAAAHRGNLVVQLRPGATWAAVETLLGAQGLTIVGGPSDGALTLSSEAKGAALDALITRLRASPLVAAADKAA